MFRNIDSNMWIAMGRRMLSGDVLYRDIWDSKGPWIFFLNEFAVWLSPRFGMFFIETVELYIVGLAIYRMVRLWKSERVARVLSFFWVPLFMFPFSSFSNCCGEHELPLVAWSFVGMYEWCKSDRVSHDIRWAFVYGLSVGCCFCMRPGDAIFVLLGVIYISVTLIARGNLRCLAANLCSGALGICVFCASFLIWAATHDVLLDMILATFIYNVTYTEVLRVAWVWHFVNCFVKFGFMIGVGVIVWIARRLRFIPVQVDLWWFVGIVGLVYLMFTPTFDHYFVVLIPVFVAFFCQFMDCVPYVVCVVGLSLLFGCFDRVCLWETYRSHDAVYASVVDEVAKSLGHEDVSSFDGSHDMLLINGVYSNYDYSEKWGLALPDTRWILFQDAVCNIRYDLRGQMRNDFVDHEADFVLWVPSGFTSYFGSVEECVFYDLLTSDYDIVFSHDGDTGDDSCDYILFVRKDVVR